MGSGVGVGVSSGVGVASGVGVGVGSGSGVEVGEGTPRGVNLGTLGVGVGVSFPLVPLAPDFGALQVPGFVGCSSFTNSSDRPPHLAMTMVSGASNFALGISKYACASAMKAFHIGPAPAELKAPSAMGVLSALPIHTSTTSPSGPGEYPSTTLSRKSSLVPVLEVAVQPKVSLLHWIALLDRISVIMYACSGFTTCRSSGPSNS